MAIGIICEYNPFHNGHLYHLEKIKEIYKDEEIILVLGGNFLQRGNLSILDKYTKTEIAINYGVDLVIELPFIYATQGADIFAKGALEILNALKCKKLIFGSESNDINNLKELANIQLSDKNYNELVKKELDNGVNYPTAMSNALKEINNSTVTTPNDILGLSYIKEIIKNNYNIEPITIKRTNNYHDTKLNQEIVSASAIRNALINKLDVKNFVPPLTYEKLTFKNYTENYFKLLKYKILTEQESISKYQTVDEGIENRIIKYIDTCDSLEELIEKIKTKRYTYNKLNRMFTHILCSLEKEEAKDNNLKYIRVLGFNEHGKKYLNKIKKEVSIPIITKLNKDNYEFLKNDIKYDKIYSLITESNNNFRIIIKKNM